MTFISKGSLPTQAGKGNVKVANPGLPRNVGH